jgi:hypothetical protein
MRRILFIAAAVVVMACVASASVLRDGPASDSFAKAHVSPVVIPDGSPVAYMSAVPEPATLALMSLGVASLWTLRRRR